MKQKYQYRLVSSYKLETLSTEINTLAADGWEVDKITSSDNGYHLIVLKRIVE